MAAGIGSRRCCPCCARRARRSQRPLRVSPPPPSTPRLPKCRCTICITAKMKRATHARTAEAKTHKVTCDCKECKVKRITHEQHMKRVQAKRSEIGDMVHCDAIVSKTVSVKDKHTGAHHFLDHASRYAVVAPFKTRTEIRTIIHDLAQYYRTNFTRSDGSPAVLRCFRWDGAPEYGKSLYIAADIARDLLTGQYASGGRRQKHINTLLAHSFRTPSTLLAHSWHTPSTLLAPTCMRPPSSSDTSASSSRHSVCRGEQVNS